eukprot:5335952-Prymnesium_polylepis.1
MQRQRGRGRDRPARRATPRDVLGNLLVRHLVEAHLTAEHAEPWEALEERESFPEPRGVARQAVVSLQQQQEVAAGEPGEPVVGADLMDVWRDEQ